MASSYGDREELNEQYATLPESEQEYLRAGDDDFREHLQVSRAELADVLDQYSGQDARLLQLDTAFQDCMEMVRVSNQRISDLRKMHALVLLNKVKSALDQCDGSGSESDDGGFSQRRPSVGMERTPSRAGFAEFSDGSDSEMGSYGGGSRRRDSLRRSSRGPDSDEFMHVVGKGGSDYGGGRHSRGVSLGGEEESVFDPEESLLSKADDLNKEHKKLVFTVDPFWVDNPPGFDSDLDKGDSESSATGDPGSEKEKDKRDAYDRFDPVNLSLDRFATRYKRKRKINWLGLLVFAAWCLAFMFYMFIRVTKTLGLGSYVVYGYFVLLVEILGASTTLIYGTNLLFDPVNKVPESALPKGSKLPVSTKDVRSSEGALDDSDAASVAASAKGGADSSYGVVDVEAQPTTGSYHIRVLIPCYNEGLEIVEATVDAIRNAVLPHGCRRTIYVCDDGGERNKYRMTLRKGPDVKYLAGRKNPEEARTGQKVKEMNGKSGNLNNACLQIYPPGCTIPFNEIICVMDADQKANPDFFVKMIPMLDGGDDVGMVLSPQAFDNVNFHGDIFNHSNIHFWEYMQPGTNFLVRSRAFQECGWSPDYTLTEDFALGMELKQRKWQCRYVCEYLAIGEAPLEVRNAFQQRSRWSKGHFQIMFSRQHCPLFKKHLSIGQKILFCSGVWSYLVTIIATPTFILVPLLTIWFGIFPIVLSIWAAAGLTAYYLATSAVLGYVRKREHIFPLWFSNVGTVIMFWTFVKALFNTLKAKFRGGLTFKTTAKGTGRLASALGNDLVVPTAILIALAVSLGIGLHKAFTGATPKTTLLVSLLWMIFNMVPPYLLLHYAFIGRGTTLRGVCYLGFVVTTVCGLGALVLIWLLYPRPFSYSTALTDSFTFYQSQMVAPLPASGYRVAWRGPAYAQDAQSPIVAPLTAALGAAHDSSGGWMVGGAGGNIKMTMPTAFTTTMLAWGLLQFPKGYGQAGARADVLNQIQVGVQFLQKTLIEYTPRNPKFFVIYQVGNLSTESRYWGYPEAFTGARPSYYVPTQIGTSDLTCAISAAFASASLAFQATNRAYAQQLLNTAADLYAVGKTYPGSHTQLLRATVCNSAYGHSQIGPTGTLIPGGLCKGPYDAFNGSAIAWYNSTSYYDDMAWAASWLYQATGQATYLNDAITYYVQHSQGPESVVDAQLLFNWNNVFWGANLKLAQLKGDAAYHRQMQYFLKYWICGTGGDPVKYTRKGRSYNNNDGTLGTTANAVFLSVAYGATKKVPVDKSKRYICWARAQTRYMLGDYGDSYVVGFGTSFPQFAQAMGASCPGFPFKGRAQNCTAAALTSRRPNPHQVTGALIEQSEFTDAISTVRASNNSRVAVEYNAGYTGALAGVLVAPGNWDQCLQGNGVLSTDRSVCQATI